MSDNVRVIHARRFNIVHLVFLVLLVYMVIILGNYISKEDVKVTEVTKGSLSQNHTYSGLILRDEEVIKSKSVGYVKCFVTDGSRVSKDGVLFAVDKKQPQTSSSQNSVTQLSDNDYKTIRKYLDNFSTKYDGMQFDDVYAFKGQLTNLLYGLEQKGLTISKEDEDEKYVRADRSCVVYFTVDGLEGVDPDEVTRDYLEKITYRPVRCSTGNSVERGQAICKAIMSDDWNVLIPINDEDYLYYSGRKSTRIYLPDLNVETFADIRINEDSEQNKVAVLTLHKYMSSYSADRIISLELVKDNANELKVPKTSVVSRELYVVPSRFAVSEEGSSKKHFLRDAESKEEATIVTEQISPNISYFDSNYYYFMEGEVNAGDVLRLMDKDSGNMTESYTVGDRKILQGVYNVNKGYAIFEVVEILEEDEDYCIVRSNTAYGLAEYDHIVLNATTVDEDDLLY